MTNGYRFGFGVFALLAALAAPLTAHAKPATTLKITESSQFTPPPNSPWFVRADLNEDLGFQGATGFGAGAGWMGKYVYVDGQLMFFRTNYRAIRLNQQGVTHDFTPMDPTYEVGRPRSDGDTGGLFTLGPGVGFILKMFGSDDWVEMGRFGANYAQFNDSTNGLTLRGFMFNAQGGVGYQWGRVVLAPGITWNFGWVKRAQGKTAAEQAADPTSANNKFLPLQWISWHFSLMFWL